MTRWAPTQFRVVGLKQLLGGERLSDPEVHMAGVTDGNIEAPLVIDDPGHRGGACLLRGDVQLKDVNLAAGTFAQAGDGGTCPVPVPRDRAWWRKLDGPLLSVSERPGSRGRSRRPL